MSVISHSKRDVFSCSHDLQRCRGIHNYSSMVAIISGLNSPPIRRLKRTWEQINARFMTQLGACEMTIDSNKNFTNYRTTLARVSPPCVPFIGVCFAPFPEDNTQFTLGSLFRGILDHAHIRPGRQQGRPTRKPDQFPQTPKGIRSHPGHQALAVAAAQFPAITKCADVHRRVTSCVQRSSGHR
jgi:RasGEF domain